MRRFKSYRLLNALFGLSCCLLLTPVQAERPMVVDDAGTLDFLGKKLEFGWSRDDQSRGWNGAAGMAPIENLELEVSFDRQRDRSSIPDSTVNANGFAAKWVPLKVADGLSGLSAGLKFDYGRSRNKSGGLKQKTHSYGFKTLSSWRSETAQLIHLNLGREWEEVAGSNTALNNWGVGFDQPLGSLPLHLTLETFGVQHQRPDSQLGLRYTYREGLKFSVAYGRGSGRNFAQAGVAWEF